MVFLVSKCRLVGRRTVVAACPWSSSGSDGCPGPWRRSRGGARQRGAVAPPFPAPAGTDDLVAGHLVRWIWASGPPAGTSGTTAPGVPGRSGASSRATGGGRWPPPSSCWQASARWRPGPGLWHRSRRKEREDGGDPPVRRCSSISWPARPMGAISSPVGAACSSAEAQGGAGVAWPVLGHQPRPRAVASSTGSERRARRRRRRPLFRRFACRPLPPPRPAGR